MNDECARTSPEVGHRKGAFFRSRVIRGIFAVKSRDTQLADSDTNVNE
jgi:hypothetical protein